MAQSSDSRFTDLLNIKKDQCLQFTRPNAVLAACPDMGGRTFAEVCGLSMHRIDIDCVRNPIRPFNNFGGGDFWPAPEGGKFGFNYRGDEWCVQQSINDLPFEVVSADENSACMQKQVVLANRFESMIEAAMRREVIVSDELPQELNGCRIKGGLSYSTIDSFEVQNDICVANGLIAAWTLEQFEATEHTTAFCIVESPRKAINFDFYDHPGDRITYFDKGFTYKTDGLSAGQIGIRTAAEASFIGFYDASRGIVSIRKNLGDSDGVYFNIADNDQPEGHYSAADNYSIFNSDPDMRAFELETVGCARVENGIVRGSKLVSATTFAVFEHAHGAEQFVMRLLGAAPCC